MILIVGLLRNPKVLEDFLYCYKRVVAADSFSSINKCSIKVDLPIPASPITKTFNGSNGFEISAAFNTAFGSSFNTAD